MALHGAPDEEPSEQLRCLVVTEELALAGAIEFALNHGRCATRTARGPEEATSILSDWLPDFLIVDFDLKGGAAMRELSQRPPGSRRVPVLGMTRRADLTARLTALSQGLDDVVATPFWPDDLVFRVFANLQRSGRAGLDLDPTIRVGDLEVDVANLRVRREGLEVALTRHEATVLYLLAGNRGRTVSREEIISALGWDEWDPLSNVVDRHVRSLRAKLQDTRPPRYVETVRGMGYRFVAETRSERDAWRASV